MLRPRQGLLINDQSNGEFRLTTNITLILIYYETYTINTHYRFYKFIV